MKLENMIVGIILFGAVMASGMTYYFEGLGLYGVSSNTNTSWGKISDNGRQLQSSIESMADALGGGTVTEGDATDDMIRGGYNVIRSHPTSMLGIVGNTTQTIMIETGIFQDHIVQAIILILSILTIFAIIGYIFNRS